jgi:hypothetical protein
MTVVGHGYDDNVGAPAFRNVIINGGMSVAQRNTSVTSITSGGYYTADRWYANAGSAGTWTQSVENDGPTGSGFRKSLKMLCTTAATSLSAGANLDIYQALEGQDLQRFTKGTSSAKQFALSFWVKSNVTGTFVAWLADMDNTRSVGATYTISASGVWEKKTIIFPADTTGVFDNDNAASLRLRFHLVAGSTYTSGTLNTLWATTVDANSAVGQVNLAAAINNYWQITGVQLEAGLVATPFEFEPFETTLRKCQRYYESSATYGAYLGSAWLEATPFHVVPYSTSSAAVQISFKVNKRVVPAVTNYSYNGIAGRYSYRDNAADNTGPVTYARISTTGIGVLINAANNWATNNPLWIGWIAECEL